METISLMVIDRESFQAFKRKVPFQIKDHAMAAAISQKSMRGRDA